MKVIEDDSQDYFEKMDARLIALQNCVKKLPAKESQLLKMRYERELPVKRIAFRMDVSVRAIYKALTRVHHILIRCVRLTLATEEIA
jgi:RNA polymerase sigma-70 factor (ECF subfamily)